MNKILDKTFLKFILVGIINTLFGTFIMFFSYNVLHFGYWISSAANYFFGSILSYFLNKNFTFEHKDNSPKVVLKFIITIVTCYFVAYGIAQPLIQFIMNDFSKTIQDNISMFIGMCIFVLLNYTGQRFFAFKNKS